MFPLHLKSPRGARPTEQRRISAFSQVLLFPNEAVIPPLPSYADDFRAFQNVLRYPAKSLQIPLEKSRSLNISWWTFYTLIFRVRSPSLPINEAPAHALWQILATISPRANGQKKCYISAKGMEVGWEKRYSNSLKSTKENIKHTPDHLLRRSLNTLISWARKVTNWLPFNFELQTTRH
ncbi:N-acetyl-D-glucosamine kinase [Platysternon megacephalum]|uniref:N-acetyl-D-glucosamine kinase n=1 Tax=Platysternon megacephalum TaxID=55544 RepID=A0A4D9E6W6_9SAUR|nr:N-acetyl-D-glucosamine kinase [Platysternon megacephalum]